MKSRLSRGVLVLHRYTGVLVGILMTVWCLSGFVMMYQSFPAVTEEEQLASLQPLDLSAPLAFDALPIADDEEIGGFRIDMLGDRPVLRMGGRRGGATYDLATGGELAELSPRQIEEVARRYAAGNDIAANGDMEIRLMDRLDQWTIQTFRSSQPVYHIFFNDTAGSEVYISAASGMVIQDTDRTERVLSWLGAIPHWLYPTVLRENGPLWTQIVIWTSVIGTFLTVTGLYVGIARLAHRRKGRLSPYKGLWYWHHMIGLVFGVLTMTWVFSGLLTMNPWGMLMAQPNSLRQEISGSATWAEVQDFLQRVSEAGLPPDIAQLRPVLLGGQLHALAFAAGDRPLRLNGEAQQSPVQETEVRAALAGLPLASFDYMTGEDIYYYSFKDRKADPVYRAILADEQRTRIYVDAGTGEVARVVDDAARQSRWLIGGLHSLDFIRGRPLWDVLTLLLLAGVTGVCGTGAWMSIRRVRRDWRVLRKRRGRHPSRPISNPIG